MLRRKLGCILLLAVAPKWARCCDRFARRQHSCLFRQPCDFMLVRSQVTLPKLRNSHAEKRFAFAHFAGPLHVLTGSSFVLLCSPTDPRLTDGPFGPQRYYLHLLLRRLVPRGSPRVRLIELPHFYRLSAVSDNERIRHRRLRKRHGDWILSAHV